MNLKEHIYTENIEEIKSLIEKKFNDELEVTFGHSNFSFSTRNIKIQKFKRLCVSAVLDDRIFEEMTEVNFEGNNEARKIKKSDIDAFTFERDNCVIENIGKIVEYRVEGTNQTYVCSTCNGGKQVGCDTCSGSGRNRCDGCDGQRKVECSSCRGKGELFCLWCLGKGTKEDGNRRVDCNWCKGRGVNPCSSCTSGYNTCSTCNGNGDVSCYMCDNSGKVDCYSCTAQGSFTKYISVRSELKQKDNHLVVNGNSTRDFISKNILTEEFTFQKEFIDYKISVLKDFKTDLKEIFSRLMPNKQQQGKMIYASLDECAALTYEILIGESTYVGYLKEGVLWFDKSVMNLLFYDVIDGMKVDTNFKNIIYNKAAFENNLDDTKEIWDSIIQYEEFEKIIACKDDCTNKIISVRKLNLLDTSVYLNHLYSKYIKRETFTKTVCTLIIIIGLFFHFGTTYIGITSFIAIPIVSLFVSILVTKNIIKSLKPVAVSSLGFFLIILGGAITVLFLSNLKINSRSNQNEKLYSNNQIESIGNLVEERHSNGQIAVTGRMVNDVKDGLWKWYYKNGVLKEETWYENGKQDGDLVSMDYKSYYDNGQIDATGRMVNGEKDGLWRWYYKNGVLKEETWYENGKQDGNSVPQDQVGDYAEGGIIFQINEDGTGLVSALEDLGSFAWGCNGTSISGADEQSIGTGYQNTLDVVAGCNDSNTAAFVSLNAKIEGYTDWYLPSKDELVEMYNTIGNGGPEGNIGGFSNYYYWSSSEYNNNNAWFVNFNNGNTSFNYKILAIRVRVIRAF